MIASDRTRLGTFRYDYTMRSVRLGRIGWVVADVIASSGVLRLGLSFIVNYGISVSLLSSSCLCECTTDQSIRYLHSPHHQYFSETGWKPNTIRLGLHMHCVVLKEDFLCYPFELLHCVLLLDIYGS